jgi:hypothetical protein
LFELPLAFLLFALALQLMLPRILLQLVLAPHAPLKCADTIFAINDLGRGDDLNSDLLNKTLDAAPFPVLPGPPLLVPVGYGENGEAQLVRTAGYRARALATLAGRPIDLPSLPCPCIARRRRLGGWRGARH